MKKKQARPFPSLRRRGGAKRRGGRSHCNFSVRATTPSAASLEAAPCRACAPRLQTPLLRKEGNGNALLILQGFNKIPTHCRFCRTNRCDKCRRQNHRSHERDECDREYVVQIDSAQIPPHHSQ